ARGLRRAHGAAARGPADARAGGPETAAAGPGRAPGRSSERRRPEHAGARGARSRPRDDGLSQRRARGRRARTRASAGALAAARRRRPALSLPARPPGAPAHARRRARAALRSHVTTSLVAILGPTASGK